MLTLADFLSLEERPSIDYTIIETMRLSSTFLDTAVFKTISGGAERLTRRNTYPTITPRAFNGAIAESTGTFSNSTEILAIYPGRGNVDIAFSRFENRTPLMTQVMMDQVTAITKRAEADIFQGVGLNDMLGLNSRLALMPGTPQLAAIAANGLNIAASAANAEIGLAGLDTLRQLVFGSDSEKIYVMNQRTYNRYMSAIRQIPGMSFNDERDLLGRPFKSYGGIPIIVMENDANNNLILPITETQGINNDCASVYCIRWNVTDGLSVLTDEKSGGGMNFYVDAVERVPGQGFGEVFVEGYFGLRMARNDSVARLTGLR